MDRFVCVHGHFYQPPRENPWLEEIELQDSAYPYHDWNERITAECYAPNAVARILDPQGRIEQLVNNYARISFDFGPTLLAWMQTKAPDVYQHILEADRDSRKRFSGHGSALALAYNHVILPLASRADKVTQVAWGVRDFEARFGREPEGFWLPETACDVQTLEVLAEKGLRFTILSPHQALRVRKVGERDWQDVSDGHIDTTMPYVCHLPSGRKIALFFFNTPITRAVAFERLLSRGEAFAGRLLSGFHDRPGPQLVHVATDGESYGHHHPHGDMALAYALHHIESSGAARLTTYAEFLERFPPTHEVEIVEGSSWSCAHGLERWRSDCGCNAGRLPSQSWRAPLRQALDSLRSELDPLFEQEGRALLKDPWAARDDYIHVLLDRTSQSQTDFLTRHARRELTEAERVRALKLMELGRHGQLMYTSCGWFFDEVSGIEAVQVLLYAGRVIQLGEELFGRPLEADFLAMLQKAPSNLPDRHRTGREVYEKYVRPARVDWDKVGGHYAVSSLFEPYPAQARMFAYLVDREEARAFEAGKIKLVVGHARLVSSVTQEETRVAYAAVHFGDHNAHGGVRPFDGAEAHRARVLEFSEAIARVDYAEILRLLDRHYPSSSYSLGSLFKDEQRKVLKKVLRAGLADTTATYGRVYEENLPLMRFLKHLGVPLPRAFQAAADFLFNTDLRWAFADDEPNFEHIRTLLHEAGAWDVQLDLHGLAYKFGRMLARVAERWRDQPAHVEYLITLGEGVELGRTMPFEPDLWKVQNVYVELMHGQFPTLAEQAHDGDESARAWVERFLALGEQLKVSVEGLKKKLAELASRPTPADFIRELSRQRRIPGATYRMQLNRDFPFALAAELVGYLGELGVTDLYSSPILQARSGSTHGYDICDHSRVSADLGGEAGLDILAGALAEHGLGLIVDTVPNHMGIGDPTNRWWQDVLENGASSSFAGYFDIDWHPVNPDLEDKVLLPILGEQYGSVLESGQLRLYFEEGRFFLRYYERELPLAPGTYTEVLRLRLDHVARLLGESSEHVQELRSILTALSHLPPRTGALTPEQIAERNREKEIIKKRIATLAVGCPEVHATIDQAVETFNGRVGTPASFDALDRLIEGQSYRPAYWRVAMEEINYRRFFDINELAAIRPELPEVFEATHQVLFRLLARGVVHGLRIDHPDGLSDPSRYFRQLQERYTLDQLRQLGAGRPRKALKKEVRAALDALAQAGRPAAWPLYVVAEKILSEGEPLPTHWAVDGTTGYEFLNALNGLFVDPAGGPALDALYREWTGEEKDLSELLHECKMTIMEGAMASEINSLSHQLDRVAERNRRYRDFTLNSLTAAIREIIACLPIYRTYITPGEPVTPRDRHFLEETVEHAKANHPDTAESVFDFVRDTLLLRNLEQFREPDRPAVLEWVMRFQQLTGPVTAKGVEDTAFYVYNRLLSLNEVGGYPDHFGLSLEAFHAQNAERARLWPNALLSTSTHDTKRSEDVRARIDVLSEIPGEWSQAVKRWRQLHTGLVGTVDGLPAPSPDDQYLFYQTLVGAWPGASTWSQPEELAGFRARMVEYMTKATKEAKVRTSWINPDEAYDSAVRSFVMGVLSAGAVDAFAVEFAAFARRVAWFGYLNSLAQTLLKLTCPGVPDIYQGTELWDFSLVDPDNRRPVDYERRRELLGLLRKEIESRSGSGPEGPAPDFSDLAGRLLANPEDGRIKLFVTHRALLVRRAKADLFARGGYRALEVVSEKADHVCAFAREDGQDRVLVVASVRCVALTGGAERPPTGEEVWGAGRVLVEEPAGTCFRDAFTGSCHRVEEEQGRCGLWLRGVLGVLPLALLERCPWESGDRGQESGVRKAEERETQSKDRP